MNTQSVKNNLNNQINDEDNNFMTDMNDHSEQ